MTDFEVTAKRLAKEIEDGEGDPVPERAPEKGATTSVEREEDEESEESEESEEEDTPNPSSNRLYPEPFVPQGEIVVEAPVAVDLLSNPNAAMLFLKADKTSENATIGEVIVDHTVQFGQPYPAITHCEQWIGERKGTMADDNHFSTYLGFEKGATWTSGFADSARFYGCNRPTDEDLTRRMARSSWSAIPIFAVDGAQRLRRDCNMHKGTPYPPAFLLWQYPMSVWPLRAFSGLVDDRIKAPAHCAALSARILRTALSETYALEHPSHWYGPSSLYLELATPMRMEQTLAREQPTVRSQEEEEELNRFADTLVQHSDDEVGGMKTENAHMALRQLAIQVLRAGSRVDDQEVDQDDFREAQERYAFGLCRYTWKFRKLK